MVVSTQLVAAAAGVALFVALMSLQTAQFLAAGASQVDALSGGIRVAFTVGAMISMLSVVMAFFVKKPAEQRTGMAVVDLSDPEPREAR